MAELLTTPITDAGANSSHPMSTCSPIADVFGQSAVANRSFKITTGSLYEVAKSLPPERGMSMVPK